jgi:putative nucleotidyltransferase with HDIG domain
MADKVYKILIVDDEEDNLELLYRTLRQKFDVIKTTSPLEALKMLDETVVDLIISDHKMPEMDGVEFLKRSLDMNPLCVRLLVTAYSDSIILIDAINEAKIYRYIKKPWRPAELMIIVEAAAEYYQLKIENDKLIYDLKALFSGTVNAIIEALDAKDSYTLGKSRRVTYLSLKMAEYLQLERVEVGKLELAGLLHDIGMIGVPDTVLLKTETLSHDDYEVIKRHVTHGVTILEDIKQLKDVVEIIKYHHERFDGSGYPSGLIGDAIPMNSRIIAVADAYDSIISDRSYRHGASHEDAIKILKSQSAKQFDPIVIDAFLAIIPDAIHVIKKSISQPIDKV